MIVVDSSALLSILLNEKGYERCIDAIASSNEIALSAATLAETLIVAVRKGIYSEATEFVEGMRCEIVPFTERGARQAADAYARWGKGVHPARLDLGDCFSYALAKDRDCPLLFVGEDFSLTDLESALPPSG